jgi:hypothetical protein
VTNETDTTIKIVLDQRNFTIIIENCVSNQRNEWTLTLDTWLDYHYTIMSSVDRILWSHFYHDFLLILYIFLKTIKI